jgi:hypothetical protein
MRLYYEFDENLSRPIVNLDDVFVGCKALIDTGALFPVWAAPEQILQKLGATRDVKLPSDKIGGFGGESKGNIYRMTVKMDSIYFIDMPFIAVEMKGSRFHLVLPATLFFGMEMNINFQNHSVTIETNSNQVSYNMHHRRNDDGTLTIYAQ